MSCMGERRALRRIGDPVVVAAAPAGVRIRTRIQLTDAEAAAVLAPIGSFLGSVYRAELAGRVELGRLDHAQHGVWRAQRKQARTTVSSSRWAGRSPELSRTNTSWACERWAPRSLIWDGPSRCWRPAAR